jgi:hypothetical protein
MGDAELRLTSAMSCRSEEVDEVERALNSLEEKSSPLGSCGSWMAQLDSLYSQDFERQPKMVFVPHVSGLSDRFVGIATVFLLSLITNRLFLLGNMPELQPLESVFEMRHSEISTIVPSHLIPMMRENKSHPGGNFLFDGTFEKSLIVNAIGDGEFLLSKQTIDTIQVANLTDLYVVSNRGRTISMFDKPFLKKKLTSMGLTKSSAFGCALRYLFRPRPEVFVPLLPTLQTLTLPDTLKIAIHIRTHDGVLVYGNKIRFENYLPWFRCAEQIESFALHSHHQQAVWVFYTDSIELRRKVLAKYGSDKVRVATDVPVEHSAKEMVCPLQSCVTQDGFNTAAAEWWNLGLADYHVVGIQGGYGKTAVMRTGRLKSTYLIQPDQLVTQISCTKKNYARTQAIKTAYAGI